MATTYKPKETSRGVLFFGVGHGGNDPGAVGYLIEEDINLEQAMGAKDYAVAEGFTVVMSRIKDENDDLNEEIREANASGALCAVEFHNNAGKGDGFEVFHSLTSDAKGGKALAKSIETEVKGIGQNSRGCKTKKDTDGTDWYGFIRLTNMPAVICEGCFVDNKADAAQFDTKAENKAYGEAVAKGTIKWLEDTGRVKKQAAAASKPAAKPAQKASTVKIELPVLSQGSKGKTVGTMQTLIEKDGISCGSAGVDKSFGPATDRAVRKYQKKHGLTEDGICGQSTWKSLLA